VDEYISAADILIIPPSSTPLTKSRRTVLPLKTFRYMAAGRPIVAPDLPDIREVLEHGHNAILVPPDSPEKAARAIKELMNDKRMQGRISENALRDSRKYTWAGRAARISAFLRELLGENDQSPSS
jgi:glycosyltransferase involved in cell wall biosynthesis